MATVEKTGTDFTLLLSEEECKALYTGLAACMVVEGGPVSTLKWSGQTHQLLSHLFGALFSKLYTLHMT